jgi:hypothetical protein
MSHTPFTFLRRPVAREILIFIAFCALTAVMTWPWIVHLRDAVADKGDPYMIAWTLWWDFHQTFHNPLHLFDANVFYPYRYTLAFSENDFGIALLFFPLFAIGLRPLTVHAIATFSGFAFSGYGSFRLTRTLTGSERSAWLAGIIFAFIPYRFHLLSQLHYLFAGWLPLTCEGLILFARKSSWKRASWLGVAFLMNALSCVTWFVMSLAPLTFTLLFLLFARRRLIRDRRFWLRGAVGMSIGLLLFSPFLIIYYRVSTLYGLRWQPWEFALNSASLTDWLRGESRNKIWHNMGGVFGAGQMLFPGLLTPLLAVAALSFRSDQSSSTSRVRYLVLTLDLIIVAAVIVAVLALGYGDISVRILGRQIIRFDQRSVSPAVIILITAVLIRAALILPSFVRCLRSRWRMDESVDPFKTQSAIAVAIGLIWTTWGFVASLGPNCFLNRWLLDHVLLFQSLRFPARAAMICYVGVALLGGIGEHVSQRDFRGRSHSRRGRCWQLFWLPAPFCLKCERRHLVSRKAKSILRHWPFGSRRPRSRVAS